MNKMKNHPDPSSEPPPTTGPTDDEPVESSKLHGRLQLVYLALKVLEVAAALLRSCL